MQASIAVPVHVSKSDISAKDGAQCALCSKIFVERWPIGLYEKTPC